MILKELLDEMTWQASVRNTYFKRHGGFYGNKTGMCITIALGPKCTLDFLNSMLNMFGSKLGPNPDTGVMEWEAYDEKAEEVINQWLPHSSAIYYKVMKRGGGVCLQRKMIYASGIIVLGTKIEYAKDLLCA